MPNIERVIDPLVNLRYNLIKRTGSDIFQGEFPSIITQRETAKARQLLARGAEVSHPPVRASFWEHTLSAPLLGQQIATKAATNGIPVNPQEVTFLLWLHELGREIDPSSYLRTDFLGDRELAAFGIPASIRSHLPSVGKLLEASTLLEVTAQQAAFQQPLTPSQEAIAENYFHLLSDTQKIVNLADNLSKRESYDLPSLKQYLASQEKRYAPGSPWTTVRWANQHRQAGAVLQYYIIEKTIAWLEAKGVDHAFILSGIEQFFPKFVLLTRHADVDNPRDIVYNRDSAMAQEDIIHISQTGQEQMHTLARLANERGFHCVACDRSPEIRAIESTEILAHDFGLPRERIREVSDLDEMYAIGPYKEKLSMRVFETLTTGNVYDTTRWGAYGHESWEHVLDRMERGFWNLSSILKTGETGIILSHGDPLTWLENKLLKHVPKPLDLRHANYVEKGNALVAVIDHSGEIFTVYSLATPNSLLKQVRADDNL